MSEGPIVVIGAGGHAKVVVSTLIAAGEQPATVLDDDSSTHGSSILDVQVAGPIEMLDSFADARVVLAIGDNQTRAKLAASLDCDWITTIHPTAWVSPDASVGPGSVIFAGAIVQPGSRIGAHVIVNSAASVSHDGYIQDFAHLAPGVRIAGNGTVEEGAFLGVGAVAIPGITVGAWATVGAGAAVVRDVHPGTIVGGVPARELGAAERENGC